MSDYVLPKSTGTCRDSVDNYLGRYVFLQHKEEQEHLDALCQSWLDTYNKDNRFFLTIDIETTSLDYKTGDILLVSVCWDIRRAVVFEPSKFNLDLFVKVLQTIPSAGHNYKFDCEWFYEKYGVIPYIFFDTMVATQIAWAGSFPGHSFGLDNVTKQLLVGYKITKEVRDDFVNGSARPGSYKNEHIEYAARDTLITHRLIPYIVRRLYNQNLMTLWNDIELPFLRTLIPSEVFGIKVDMKELKNKCVEVTAKANLLNEEIQNMLEQYIKQGIVKHKGPFNPNSGKQIAQVLSDLSIKLPNVQEGTMIRALAQTHNPLLEKIMNYRKVLSILSKYLVAWTTKYVNPKTDCIHPHYSSAGARTGRPSSSDPNVQNIPERDDMKFRSLIIPHKPTSKILSLDYSQYEFRTAAAATDEPVLIEAYKERAELLPEAKIIAARYNIDDPDKLAKQVVSGELTVLPHENELITKLANTDVHRRNGSAMFGVPPESITAEQRLVSKCVSVNTLLHTEHGVVRVGDLLPSKRKKDTYYPLPKNFRVVSDGGLQEAKQIYYQGHTKSMEISLQSGRKIICSPVHRFRCYLDRHELYDWVTALGLHIGTELFVKLGNPEPNKSKISADAFKVAVLLKYGYILKESILLKGIDKDQLSRLESVIEKSAKINRTDKGILIKSEELMNIALGLNLNGEVSLPIEYLNTSSHKKEVKTLLKQILRISAWYKDSPVYSINSRSRTLSVQLQNLLAFIGVNSRIRERNNDFEILIEGHDNKSISSYIEGNPIETDTNDPRTWESYSPSPIARKLIEARYSGISLQDSLETVLSKKEYDIAKFFVENRLRRDKVIDIKEIESAELCDITVPSNHTLVYDSIVSHNTIGYALLYGAGPPRIHESLTKEGFLVTEKDCQEFYNKFFVGLPKIKEFITEVHKKVMAQGYVTTVLGRKRFFVLPPKYMTRLYTTKKEEAYRESLNFLFQGNNADAIKLAVSNLVEVFEETYPEEIRPMILLTVHDEIVIEADETIAEEAADIAEKVMIRAGEKSTGYKIPIECSRSISDRWGK